MWLALAGGVEAAQSILQKSASPSAPIDPKFLGAETTTYSPRANIQNQSDKWDVQILAEPSAIQHAHLFVSIDIWFRIGTKYAGVEQQVQLVEGVMPKLLSSIGLQLEPEAGGAKK